MPSNTYERLAINLAELIDDLDGDPEASLRDLLIRAYQEAYRRAAIGEIEPLSELAVVS
ncbi:MAG TPA: hypothetical protein VK862_02540 [Afifellaceae bacterium]|nr:hypothetical protein [Afifellaceae bacterium]